MEVAYALAQGFLQRLVAQLRNKALHVLFLRFQEPTNEKQIQHLNVIASEGNVIKRIAAHEEYLKIICVVGIHEKVIQTFFALDRHKT